jgi:CMP/dCMP kinase
MKNFIVTIDGSAWTGKTTTAKALAGLLGYQYISSGYLFKATAYFMIQNNLDETQREKIVELIKSLKMEFRQVEGGSNIFVNGEDITQRLFPKEVVELTSKIAVLPEVREEMLRIQREICNSGGYVIEGRDAGTVAFPDAKWKFFLDASMEIKIKRFFKQMSEEEKYKHNEETVRKTIEEIDERDRTREIAPLRKADDALLYDNSLSPSAERDAIVLWNYIVHKDQIIENSKVLENFF